MKSLFGSHMQLCAKVMDLRLQRQNLVIGNIANANTPGYRARRLDFEDKLQSAMGNDSKGAMSRTHGEHMPITFRPERFEGDWEKEFTPRQEHGQDPVDLDKEMAILNKNSMLYNALAQVVRGGFQGIEKIINSTKQ